MYNYNYMQHEDVATVFHYNNMVTAFLYCDSILIVF